MKILGILLGALLVTTGLAVPAQSASYKAGDVFLITDSLGTHGMAEYNKIRPYARWDAKNGRNVDECATTVKRDLPKFRKVVVLALGTNPPVEGHKAWTKADYLACIRLIPHKYKVVLPTMYRDPVKYSAENDPRNRAAVLTQYSQWVREIAANKRVWLAGWRWTVTHYGPDKVLYDGTHQSHPYGERLWAEAVDVGARRALRAWEQDHS